MRGRVKLTNVKEPVSFHLSLLLGNEYILPVGKSSVDVLRSPFHRAAVEGKDPTENPAFRLVRSNSQLIMGRSPNFTDTKIELWVKKFVSSQSDYSDTERDFDKVWQDRLLIATEKRIFIVTKKKNNVSFETEEHS